ncbi:MAG: pyrroline-5-carboxylate reductase [Atopobiaceae bacterium]|jgi:pyrroline-5-carboxylate reductase|nr:pyrroline-5-carboxylate reductase [Atopobiaceae bacterium]MCH4180483.1 pyrroline-5-carboxylate reductase [Atopobiaceae bacterium]MCH4214177.1 pyrroline-5-carboxylate reductase [Atopobiaceae bacterium]MCH4229478.1 pyrroline-5-carboxylate reductase [Atopobiaceae bacterium]MCH4275843.1 pyrroline-5-carboxylate reductase [Atopobiaceae bacterium]
MISATVGIMGAGSMGASIARGLVSSGTCSGPSVFVCDHHHDTLQALADEHGVVACPDAAALVAAAPDVILLAVKPQVLNGAIASLASCCHDRLVVSIAAGVSLATLETALPDSRVVRVMPNLPVSVRSGASAITAGSRATSADVELVTTLFSALGSAHVMREDQLDAEGAVVGCAPAYFALLVDTLTRAGIRAGLPAAAAREMLEATMAGTAESLLASGDHPRCYLEGVTSPGGTTAAALTKLEPAVMQASYDAIDAALARTRELAGD